MEKITRADIKLVKSTERGGFHIMINDELWGVAAPRFMGGRGLMHCLRYPNAGAIQDKQNNGYRFGATIRSHHMRHREWTGPGEVLSQQEAIKDRMADLINRGLVESPAEIKERRESISKATQEARDTRTRHEDWTRDGLISLSKRPDITDKESFAVKHAYREIFCSDMPEGNAP